MPKALSISSLVVAVLLLVLFGMDIAIGVPFRGVSTAMDVGFIVCAILLAYLGWNSFREQV